MVIRDDGGGAGLLEHDLGNPDCVGIGRAAPGQIAMAAGVPVGEQGRKTRRFTRWTRSHSATTAKSSGACVPGLELGVEWLQANLFVPPLVFAGRDFCGLVYFLTV